MSHTYITRGAEREIEDALAFSPAVTITGARQTGKSTLAQRFFNDPSDIYVTLDDPLTLEWAQSDPSGFISRGEGARMVIDEIQRMPELTLSIKASIDRNRTPGRFIITGSSDLARVEGANDSLAGRTIFVKLDPLSLAERAGGLQSEPFVDLIVRESGPPRAWLGQEEEISRRDTAQLLAVGGYPLAQALPERSRNMWFGSYIEALIRLDQKEISPARLEKVLTLLSTHQAGELVKAKLAREAEMPESTVRLYLDSLERLFLIETLKPWKPNLTSREIGKPKIVVADSGLAAYLLGQSIDTLANPGVPSAFAQLYEGLIAQELITQSGWSHTRYSVHHWRDRTGKEVDLIIELADSRVIAIEVKSTPLPRKRHFAHLEFLREQLGDRFVAGLVVGPFPQVVPFGDRLWTIPHTRLYS